MVTKDVLVGEWEIVVVANVENRAVLLASSLVCEVGDDALADVECCGWKVVVDGENGRPVDRLLVDKGDVGSAGVISVGLI